ncbi:class I SAM-dependent methyltransferase [Dactylosporangium sp. CA-052675]|uniref:class I SAM-dependent methyltransferase n=1 Tax=Dactylosporangium sp. CA-052675 TaxID=3239927 RepID=UPI003D901761
MRGSSRSAEHVALFRALEHNRRHDRLFDDRLAVRMLPPLHRAVATASRVPAVHRWIVRYLDHHFAGGPRASAVVRTRFIDDQIRAAGAPQLVLLGAGFDNRAHRLAGPVAFEVDHPATQATKRRRVPAGGAVRYVPVDLTRDALAPALLAAGFDASAPAVVVWEGVTNYLTAESVDATLRALAGLLAPGSTVVFTYVDRAALESIESIESIESTESTEGTESTAGAGTFTGLAQWHDAVRRGGEPWTFGFDPAELAGYLEQRALHLTEDLSTRDAAARYLEPLGRDEPTAEFYRIAVCRA